MNHLIMNAYFFHSNIIEILLKFIASRRFYFLFVTLISNFEKQYFDNFSLKNLSTKDI